MFVGLTCYVEDWWPVWCHVDMRKCVCVLHLSTWVPAAVYSQLQFKKVWRSAWTALGRNYRIWNNMAMFQDLLGCLLKQTICVSSCGMIETLLHFTHDQSLLQPWTHGWPSKTTATCPPSWSSIKSAKKSLVVIHRFYFTCFKLTKAKEKAFNFFFLFFFF